MAACVTLPRMVDLFPADVTRGWRRVRRVTTRQGEQQADRGLWARIFDSVSGILIGYQMLSAHGDRGDADVPSMHSPAAISEREMEINAGLAGRSRTSGLTEDDRLARRQPEDRVERTRAKVMVWPQVGTARGDVLRVWPL